MMARVRSVMRRSMSQGSMLKVSRSESANTGMQFWSMMPRMPPVSVTGVVITSSPGSGLMAAMAVWIAEVAEFVGTAKPTPWRSAIALQKALTLVRDLHLWRSGVSAGSAASSITSARCRFSSSPKYQRGPKGLVRREVPPWIASFSGADISTLLYLLPGPPLP